MKLIFLALGVVGGIFLAMNHPDIAMNIFSNFLVFVEWVKSFVDQVLNGGI